MDNKRNKNFQNGQKFKKNGQQNSQNYKNKFNKNEKFQKPKFQPFKKREPTWKLMDDEIKTLTDQYDQIDSSKVVEFKDFPLSKRTLEGLKRANYTKPTEIQRESIALALNGHDILGAARTGSGKTLAFLIPILECLYRLKWTKMDGLGALIISPTRELAYQTFEVLKKIGCKHDFSAGLVIGGKDLKTETEVITKASIIVCTPGRLLQHMDETYNFNCDQLKMLILDEADRILDMGFSQSLNAIISNLPKTRQTLLYSATQTKSIKDLARLSLKNPTYVSVHEHSDYVTPENLDQNYTIVEAHEKLNFLWSFIRNHLNSKIIVFFQSCKQVKYAYEIFNKMGVGMNILALYGTMNQLRRMDVYDKYCRKMNSILLATDIAARGLDFPSINWVVQFDCPVDVNTYIHRVGRTARYEKDGQSLLMITENESLSMIEMLRAKKIVISELNVNKKRLVTIDSKLQSLCAEDVELKESAKRALMAYLKSLYLINNKKVFDIEKLDLPKLASSYGLSVAPRIRFLNKNQSQKQTAQKRKAEESDEESDSEEQSDSDDDDNNGIVDDEEDDLFTVKRVYNAQDDSDEQEDEIIEDDKNLKKLNKVITKATIAKRLKKKHIVPNQKVEYDEEGNVIKKGINTLKAKIADGPSEKEVGGIDIERAREMLKAEDKFDKDLYRQKIKQKHTEKRLKEKEKRREKRGNRNHNDDEDDEGTVAMLGSHDDHGDEEENGTEGEEENGYSDDDGEFSDANDEENDQFSDSSD